MGFYSPLGEEKKIRHYLARVRGVDFWIGLFATELPEFSIIIFVVVKGDKIGYFNQLVGVCKSCS